MPIDFNMDDEFKANPDLLGIALASVKKGELVELLGVERHPPQLNDDDRNALDFMLYLCEREAG